MPSAEVMALGNPGQNPLYTLGTTPGGWGILRGTGAFFVDRVRDRNSRREISSLLGSPA